MGRNYALDTVKCLAVMAVVLIHATAPLSLEGIATFWNYDWYRFSLNFAVPFFFAASGFLLYHKTKNQNEGNEYVWNYALKILTYWIGATIFYISFRFVLLLSNRLFLDSAFRPAVAKIVSGWNYGVLFNGTLGWYHLYFLSALFFACVLLMGLRRLRLDAKSVLLIGTVLYLLSLVGYLRLEDLFPYRTGILTGFFFLAIGYFVSSLDSKRIRHPEFGLLTAFVLYGLCSFWARSITALPLALVIFFIVALCAKYPGFGRDTVLATWGARSLEIFILHDACRVVVERVFIYAGVTRYFESPWYFLIAIPFSFFVPMAIWAFISPHFKRLQTATGW